MLSALTLEDFISQKKPEKIVDSRFVDKTMDWRPIWESIRITIRYWRNIFQYHCRRCGFYSGYQAYHETESYHTIVDLMKTKMLDSDKEMLHEMALQWKLNVKKSQNIVLGFHHSRFTWGKILGFLL